MRAEELQRDAQLKDRWECISNPGHQHTENAFRNWVQGTGKKREILNAAIPFHRALALTNSRFPNGLSIQDCITTCATGKRLPCLDGWDYEPHIRAVPQLPQMAEIPANYKNLIRSPWFQGQSPAAWLGINARHLRYNHYLWQQMKPRVLQGVSTTMVLVMPQIGYALSPHIQTEKAFLFLGALGRGLGPVQLFPAKYLYPGADLDSFGDAPAPIFADILPLTGGFAFPVVDCEPEPWRTLARFGQSDRYYGYPFHEVKDPTKDFSLQGYERGVMLLPNGQRVTARRSESFAHATHDAMLTKELLRDRDSFENTLCLLRGSVTHDGLPFQLPVEMQGMVFAIILTHWRMELDKPGDLTSYTVKTEHAAIRSFNYFQRVEPFYSNFMSLIRDLSKDPDFKTFPITTHLTNSWLGGNLQLANRLSRSEKEFGATAMRSYYHQQLDWMAGVTNLMNIAQFRRKAVQAGSTSKTGRELEEQLDLEGLAMHQMHRILRFDSYLFNRPLKVCSPWPDSHPGWTELDTQFLTESLPKM